MNRMNTKGQESSKWGFLVFLILGLIALLFLIWLAAKSGQTTVEQIMPIR